MRMPGFGFRFWGLKLSSPPQDHLRYFRVLAKGPLALKDYRNFPRALANLVSARKVICLIKGIITSQLM